MPGRKDNYFVRVARYQKQHPRTTRAQAMKAVSAQISGKPKHRRKKAVTTRKRAAAPRKRSVTKTERITTIGKRVHHTSPLRRGLSISRKIDELEILLKNTSGTQAKNHIKRLINAEHDKLDLIAKRLTA